MPTVVTNIFNYIVPSKKKIKITLCNLLKFIVCSKSKFGFTKTPHKFESLDPYQTFVVILIIRSLFIYIYIVSLTNELFNLGIC